VNLEQELGARKPGDRIELRMRSPPVTFSVLTSRTQTHEVVN